MKQIRYWKIADGCYQLAEDYLYPLPPEFSQHQAIIPFATLVNGRLAIHRGFAWDGPSGPTVDTSDSMRGSLVHDVLYRMIAEGKLPPELRKPADDVLYRILLEDGMNQIRAHGWHLATHAFGKSEPRPVLKAPVKGDWQWPVDNVG